MASGGKAHRFPDAWYDGAPAWVLEARKDIGIREALPSGKSNPTVLQFFADCGHSWVRDARGTPWCAAWFGAKVKAGGMPTTGSLMARSYLQWGSPRRGPPQIGDAVVFWRGRRNDGVTGHIGIFIRRDSRYVYALDGNTSDKVSESRHPIGRVLEFRKPPATVAASASATSDPPKGAGERKTDIETPAANPTVQNQPAKTIAPATPVPFVAAPVPSMAWQTTVVRELAPVSRKVTVLSRVRLALSAFWATLASLFTLENLGVAREWIEQVTALVKGNAPLILMAGAVLGVALASYLLSCIADDHKSGRYQPSGTLPPGV